MPRPRIARLFDHTATVWRPVPSLGTYRERVETLTDVGTLDCAVNRPTARLGEAGPGLVNSGERMVYLSADADIAGRDVLELLTGPEAGMLLEVDEAPTNVRGHHIEARARLWAGTLPDGGS